MSEEATTEVEAGGTSGWTPPASQEEYNRVIAERVSRERAKYADYGDLKTKASQFDDLSNAQKTEVQKAIDRAEAAERALSESKSEALRNSVLAKHQIPEEYQDFVFGATEEELTARAEKVQTLISARSDIETPAPAPASVRELMVSHEGKSPALALNGDGIEAALRQKLGIN